MRLPHRRLAIDCSAISWIVLRRPHGTRPTNRIPFRSLVVMMVVVQGGGTRTYGGEQQKNRHRRPDHLHLVVVVAAAAVFVDTLFFADTDYFHGCDGTMRRTASSWCLIVSINDCNRFVPRTNVTRDASPHGTRLLFLLLLLLL